MKEREIKQLLRLLDKYRDVSEPDEKLNPRERVIIAAIRQWIVWYGRDTLSMDL